MRSPSEDAGDNITPAERGPQGPGGTVDAGVPHIEAGIPAGGGRSEGMSQPDGQAGNVGIGLNLPSALGRLIAELTRCLVLEAVLGKTHRTEF